MSIFLVLLIFGIGMYCYKWGFDSGKSSGYVEGIASIVGRMTEEGQKKK